MCIVHYKYMYQLFIRVKIDSNVLSISRAINYELLNEENMFSRQVLCAVYVLNELDELRKQQGHYAGLKKAELDKLEPWSGINMSRVL